MEKNNSLRKVPFKNYVLLVILFIVTFLLTFYIYRWYVVYLDYQNNIPIIKDTLPEVSEEEMKHYILENSTSAIYVCTASDNECRTFEKSFKKLIEKEGLKEYITYVNLEDKNKDSFINKFNSNYPYKKVGLTKYPALIYFEYGQVVDMIQASDDEKLSISDVKKFIKNNKIGLNSN